ncbi:hypothetical protein LCGC14_2500130 [marine sediment metagenome]|uniref:Uncharacterized protein n=1 Tax=marine sediment metagenome TaxID=412755 RepID=A0A0F9DDX7_9ZZZZ
MSNLGKLTRGLKWWKDNRDLDGVLKPVISNDTDKMLDVNLFLEYCKGKDKSKVEVALHQLHLLRHAEGGVKSQLFKDLNEKVNSGSGFEVEKVVKEKK